MTKLSSTIAAFCCSWRRPADSDAEAHELAARPAGPSDVPGTPAGRVTGSQNVVPRRPGTVPGRPQSAPTDAGPATPASGAAFAAGPSRPRQPAQPPSIKPQDTHAATPAIVPAGPAAEGLAPSPGAHEHARQDISPLAPLSALPAHQAAHARRLRTTPAAAAGSALAQDADAQLRADLLARETQRPDFLKKPAHVENFLRTNALAPEALRGGNVSHLVNRFLGSHGQLDPDTVIRLAPMVFGGIDQVPAGEQAALRARFIDSGLTHRLAPTQRAAAFAAALARAGSADQLMKVLVPLTRSLGELRNAAELAGLAADSLLPHMSSLERSGVEAGFDALTRIAQRLPHSDGHRMLERIAAARISLPGPTGRDFEAQRREGVRAAEALLGQASAVDLRYRRNVEDLLRDIGQADPRHGADALQRIIDRMNADPTSEESRPGDNAHVALVFGAVEQAPQDRRTLLYSGFRRHAALLEPEQALLARRSAIEALAEPRSPRDRAGVENRWQELSRTANLERSSPQTRGPLFESAARTMSRLFDLGSHRHGSEARRTALLEIGNFMDLTQHVTAEHRAAALTSLEPVLHKLDEEELDPADRSLLLRYAGIATRAARDWAAQRDRGPVFHSALRVLARALDAPRMLNREGREVLAELTSLVPRLPQQARPAAMAELGSLIDIVVQHNPPAEAEGLRRAHEWLRMGQAIPPAAAKPGVLPHLPVELWLDVADAGGNAALGGLNATNHEARAAVRERLRQAVLAAGPRRPDLFADPRLVREYLEMNRTEPPEARRRHFTGVMNRYLASGPDRGAPGAPEVAAMLFDAIADEVDASQHQRLRGDFASHDVARALPPEQRSRALEAGLAQLRLLEVDERGLRGLMRLAQELPPADEAAFLQRIRAALGPLAALVEDRLGEQLQEAQARHANPLLVQASRVDLRYRQNVEQLLRDFGQADPQQAADALQRVIDRMSREEFRDAPVREGDAAHAALVFSAVALMPADRQAMLHTGFRRHAARLEPEQALVVRRSAIEVLADPGWDVALADRNRLLADAAQDITMSAQEMRPALFGSAVRTMARLAAQPIAGLATGDIVRRFMHAIRRLEPRHQVDAVTSMAPVIDVLVQRADLDRGERNEVLSAHFDATDLAFNHATLRQRQQLFELSLRFLSTRLDAQARRPLGQLDQDHLNRVAGMARHVPESDQQAAIASVDALIQRLGSPAVVLGAKWDPSS